MEVRRSWCHNMQEYVGELSLTPHSKLGLCLSFLTCHVKATADVSRPSAFTLMWFTQLGVSDLVTLSYWSTSSKSVSETNM